MDAEKLIVTKVPPTLTGVLQARLDGLPAAEKRALQQASVVGAVFWDQALAAVETQAAEQLPALVQRELTLPRPDSQLDGLREYAFRHQILHQVTYDTVLKRHKREGHARVALWLASLSGLGSLRAGEFLGLAAEHFELAGDEDIAAEFHSRAAEQAGQRMAHGRVLEHVGRALALLGDAQAVPPAQADLRWRLLSTREKTLGLQARRDEQAADLDALAKLADELDDDHRRADVAVRRARRAGRMADWATQESVARHGIDCATRADDDGLRLHLQLELTVATMSQGDNDTGKALVLQGLVEARSLGLRGVEANQLNLLAIDADRLGDLVGALDMTRQSLQAFRETGDRVGEAVALSNLGRRWLKLGDLVQAQRDLNAALQMLRANNDRVVEIWALAHLSELALWRGNETRAMALARQALDIAVEVRAPDYEYFAGLILGDAVLALGRVVEAKQAFTQAQTRVLEIDGLAEIHEASAGLARVALVKGDTNAALAALQPLLDHIATGGTLIDNEHPRLIELTCHHTLARAGDPRAAEWLSRAHTALMAQADTITDAALRHGFLHNIPHHREIVAAWSKRSAPDESPAKSTG